MKVLAVVGPPFIREDPVIQASNLDRNAARGTTQGDFAIAQSVKERKAASRPFPGIPRALSPPAMKLFQVIKSKAHRINVPFYHKDFLGGIRL